MLMPALRKEFLVGLREGFPVAWLVALSVESSQNCRRRHHHHRRHLRWREIPCAWVVN
jgi:hypothetical protein